MKNSLLLNNFDYEHIQSFLCDNNIKLTENKSEYHIKFYDMNKSLQIKIQEYVNSHLKNNTIQINKIVLNNKSNL